jgi:hypothetical protein
MKNYSKNLKFNPIMCIVALVGLILFAVLVGCGVESVYSLAVFTPCLRVISDNMSQNCDNPRVAGYEDIALIFNRSDIDWTSVIYNASNKRIVEDLQLLQDKVPYVIYNPRLADASFNGTQTELNADTRHYTKTLQFYYKGIGGEASANVVEPLAKGEYVVILQRKDHSGHGSFQILGLQNGIYATEQVQDETTGYWLMTMAIDEPYAETELFKTDYATTKANFDALVARA